MIELCKLMLLICVFTTLEFMDSDITVSISFSTTPTAGDLLNLTCSATVPERLVERHKPYIVISYDNLGQDVVSEDNPNATQYNVTRVDNAFSRIVNINPVKTSDAREYFCEVSFGAPFNAEANESSELSVHSKCLLKKIILLHAFIPSCI